MIHCKDYFREVAAVCVLLVAAAHSNSDASENPTQGSAKIIVTQKGFYARPAMDRYLNFLTARSDSAFFVQPVTLPFQALSRPTEVAWDVGGADVCAVILCGPALSAMSGAVLNRAGTEELIEYSRATSAYFDPEKRRRPLDERKRSETIYLTLGRKIGWGSVNPEPLLGAWRAAAVDRENPRGTGGMYWDMQGLDNRFVLLYLQFLNRISVWEYSFPRRDSATSSTLPMDSSVKASPTESAWKRLVTLESPFSGPFQAIALKEAVFFLHKNGDVYRCKIRVLPDAEGRFPDGIHPVNPARVQRSDSRKEWEAYLGSPAPGPMVSRVVGISGVQAWIVDKDAGKVYWILPGGRVANSDDPPAFAPLNLEQDAKSPERLLQSVRAHLGELRALSGGK